MDTYHRSPTLQIYKHTLPPEEVRYVRFVRESGGLGDAIRVLTMGQGLRLKYPKARVHFFGADYLESLIAPRSKAFDLFIPCEFGLRGRDVPLDEGLYPHLNTGIKYDVSLNGWCPPYLHEPNTKGICCQDRTELWAMVGGLPWTRPKLKLLEQDKIVRDEYKKKYKGSLLVGIQPGATCRSREWPYEYWDTLCKKLYKNGVKTILFDVCWRWANKIDIRNIETSINDNWFRTLGKLSACNLVLTPDSGFYHLAGSLEIPALGIFGCTSGQIISRPWRWGKKTGYFIQMRHKDIDYSKLPRHGSQGVPCRPICYMRWERGWDAARYRTDTPIYCAIIEQITPDMVFEKAMRIMKDNLGTQFEGNGENDTQK